MENLDKNSLDLRELLAEYAHDSAWSTWMEYMFTTGVFNEDGTWTMPSNKVTRWQRQMSTPYQMLPDKERDSDREQADKILEVIKKKLIANLTYF